jgi:hypothetical protein
MSSPSIEQLQELPLPAAISYLPQTWGWVLLLVTVALVLVAWLTHKAYRWHLNRYRREALARLSQLEQQLDNLALREIPVLLKRVALSCPQHPDVASLGGGAWQDFLQRNTPVQLPEDFSVQLAALAYAPDAVLEALDEQKRRELLKLSRQWVETHHVPA